MREVERTHRTRFNLSSRMICFNWAERFDLLMIYMPDHDVVSFSRIPADLHNPPTAPTIWLVLSQDNSSLGGQ